MKGSVEMESFPQYNQNTPMDSVAGTTSSSGTGPGIADGL